VYSRADLSRTVALVVALFLTAIATSAVAREFRAADTRSEDYPTVQALPCMGRAGAIDLDRSKVALIGKEILDSFAPNGFVGRKVE
jgi:hypothetical protein